MLLVLGLSASLPAEGQGKISTGPNIFQATLQEAGQKAPEISTEALRQVLLQGHAVVIDARPHQEYAIGHLPGALNVSAKPGVPVSQYVSDVAEIGRLLNHDKTSSIVLYCNGPFCGKSKRLSAELVKAGYTHVQRYQLGMPVWRALGGVMQIEFDGLLHVLKGDQTAVFIDVRERADFETWTVPGARNLPASGMKNAAMAKALETAKNDGRLPMQDHNTRIIVLGQDRQQAQVVAEALAHQAFDNVAFFGGTSAELHRALADLRGKSALRK